MTQELQQPAFSRESIEMLDAMGLGPVWLLRDSMDPLVPTGALRPAGRTQSPSPKRSAVPARAELTAAKMGSLPQAPQSARAAQTSAASPTVPQAVAQPAVGMSTELLSKIASADWQALQTLSQHCTACALSAMGRQHVVFSDGGPGPKLVVVGEAPGAEEDLQGIPFVGKSGKLLTAMLDSLGLVRRRDCVILNVLKCRPPRNRNPQPEEIVCCGHWLARQLELIKPDVLFLAGRFAISSLLKPADEMFSISKMRGRIHLAKLPDGRQVPAVATYHPSYLLRSPAAKSKAWEDLLLLKAAMKQAGLTLPVREKHWD